MFYLYSFKIEVMMQLHELITRRQWNYTGWFRRKVKILEGDSNDHFGKEKFVWKYVWYWMVINPLALELGI